MDYHNCFSRVGDIAESVGIVPGKLIPAARALVFTRQFTSEQVELVVHGCQTRWVQTGPTWFVAIKAEEAIGVYGAITVITLG